MKSIDKQAEELRMKIIKHPLTDPKWMSNKEKALELKQYKFDKSLKDSEIAYLDRLLNRH